MYSYPHPLSSFFTEFSDSGRFFCAYAPAQAILSVVGHTAIPNANIEADMALLRIANGFIRGVP
jgi:hypothetical protein